MKSKRICLGNDRRYTFKLYPTAEQREVMLQQCSMVAMLWNGFMELEEQQYRRVRGQRGVVHDASRKAHLSCFDLGAMIKPLRKECPEWAEASTWTAYRVADAVSKAFEAFFRRARQGAGASAGYPRFRSYSKGQHNWLPYRFASGCKLTHLQGNSWSVYLKGVPGLVHCRGRLPSADPADRSVSIAVNKWSDADVRVRDGVWWLSVGVQVDSRIAVSEQAEPTRVRLDCIDCFAQVNGRKLYAFDLGVVEDPRIADVQRKMAQLDRRQSFDAYDRLRRAKHRLEARQARRRRERLHEWTTQLVRHSSVIELVRPASVREVTQSGKGDEQHWGAAVETKAILNRLVLSMAPAMAVQMIRYKAAEAGVELIEHESNHLEVGNRLVQARKASRRVRSIINEVSL